MRAEDSNDNTTTADGSGTKRPVFPAIYANLNDLNGANIGTSSVLHRFFGCLTGLTPVLMLG